MSKSATFIPNKGIKKRSGILSAVTGHLFRCIFNTLYSPQHTCHNYRPIVLDRRTNDMNAGDDNWEEDEAAERYPFLYGVEEEPYEPPRLAPKYQKILDLERAKLVARREVADEQ